MSRRSKNQRRGDLGIFGDLMQRIIRSEEFLGFELAPHCVLLSPPRRTHRNQKPPPKPAEIPLWVLASALVYFFLYLARERESQCNVGGVTFKFFLKKKKLLARQHSWSDHSLPLILFRKKNNNNPVDGRL